MNKERLAGDRFQEIKGLIAYFLACVGETQTQISPNLSPQSRTLTMKCSSANVWRRKMINAACTPSRNAGGLLSLSRRDGGIACPNQASSFSA